MMQGGFASEVGQQLLVSALSACSPAVRQLGLLLEHCTDVVSTAAAGAQGAAHGRGVSGRICLTSLATLLCMLFGF
jgi:hypothetical protein